MNIIEQIKNNKKLKRLIITLTITCTLLLCSNILLSIKILASDTKTILLPAKLEKEAYVTEHTVSEEYLELHARDIVMTILNLTADNYEYASKTILRITHPRAYGQMKQELGELATDIKERNVSISFLPNKMLVDAKNLMVEVQGILKTNIATRLVSEKQRKYRVIFDYTHGLLSLSEFYEVIDDKQ